MDKVSRPLSPGDIAHIKLGNEANSYIVTRTDAAEITLDNNWHIRSTTTGYECIELSEANKVHRITFTSSDKYFPIQNYQVGDIINVITKDSSYRLPVTAITIDELISDDTSVIFVDGKPFIKDLDPNSQDVIITKKDILTGIPDMERLIYSHLDPKSLARLTRVTPKILGTKDDKVWKEKVDQDYPGLSQYKPVNITYYKQYQDLYRKKDTSLLESEYNAELLLNYGKDDRLDLIVHTNAFKLLRWRNTVVINTVNTILQYDRMAIFKKMLKSGLDHDAKMIISDILLGDYEKYYNYILVAIEDGDGELREMIAGDAMRHDHPNIAMEIINKYNNVSLLEISNLALENGYIEILDVLEKRGVLPKLDSIHFAYMNGKYDALEWCAKRNILPSYSDMEQIIDDSILHAVQSLVEGLERGHHFIPPFWITLAVSHDKLELLEYLYDHDAILIHKDADLALYNEDFDILEFYYQHDILPTSEGLSEAINGNKKEGIIWAIERGVPVQEIDLIYMDDDILDVVAQYDYDFDNSYFDRMEERVPEEDYYIHDRLKALKDRGIWK